MAGGRKETVSDEEILSLFTDANDPFLSTSEVAKALDFTNKGARKRLYKLEEEGLLTFKKVGNSPAFWLTDEGKKTIN